MSTEAPNPNEAPRSTTPDVEEPQGALPAKESAPEAPPIGLIAPEWALTKSARGSALWRHAGVMTASAKEKVEVIALDRAANGRRFEYRDEWNIPAPGMRFRVRRVKSGTRLAASNALEQARLEGLVLDWVRVRKPRLAHVLDLDGFGPGVLLALEAAGIPTVVTLDRARELKASLDARLAAGDDASDFYAEALSSARRIIVRSAPDAGAAEACGAPREKVRVMKAGADGDIGVLRAYASLYRLLAPRETDASKGPAAALPSA